jgi:hypothetical protein
MNWKQQQAEKTKDEQMVKSKALYNKRMETMEAVYNSDLVTYQRLIQKTANKIYENNKNEQYYQLLSDQTLHQIIQTEEENAQDRLQRRGKFISGRKRQEIHRLRDILSYDHQQLTEEKAFLKALESQEN